MASKHIIWYAKGWYKRSGDLLDDLRELIHRYSMHPKDKIQDQWVVQQVASIWSDLRISDHVRSSIWHELYKPAWSRNPVPEDIPGHPARACRLMLTDIMQVIAEDLPEMPEKYKDLLARSPA